MSGTYIAWNGEPYPWPPPDGWYEGSDGRWWAPGSGPEPHSGIKKAEHNTNSADDAGVQIANTFCEPQATESEPDIVQSDQQTVMAKPSARPLPRHTEVVGAGLTDPKEPLREVAVDEGDDGLFRSPLLLSGVAVLVLLGTGIGYLAVRDNNDEPTTRGQPTTTVVFGETTLPPATTAFFGETTLPPTTLNQSEPTPATVPPTTIPQSNSITTAAEPARTTTTSSTDEQKALAFRADVSGKGINSAELSDDDIIDFGKSFCVFAVVSVDSADFDTYRSRAQTGITGTLNEAQLDAAINAAIVSFCPEEAERLSIES